jgi:hypothetical protein
MTAIAHFPMTPTMRARLNACDDAVTYARAILRSEAPHASDDIRLACRTLMTWGNEWDWLDAYHVLRALDAPAPMVTPEPDDPPAWTIRDELTAYAGLAVIVSVCWVLLRVVA